VAAAVDDYPLACAGIIKTYGAVNAVDGVDLTFHTGEITAIVGANGAGKTTLLDMLSGALKASAGVVSINGHEVTHLSGWRRARRGMLRCFQDAALFPSLSVRETLSISAFRTHRYGVFHAILRSPVARRRDAEVREAVEATAARYNLTKWLATPLTDLSLGMIKIVQLAAVMVAKPRWALLDEPAAGLARAEVDALGVVLREISESMPETGLLIVEHDAQLVSAAAKRVILMAEGKVIDDLRRTDPGWRELLHDQPAATSESGRVVPQPGIDAERVDESGLHETVTAAFAANGMTTPSASAIPASADGGDRLVASDLTIAYGRFVAVRNVSLEIQPYRLSVLVGTNGAGKSSILNAISGLRSPQSGRVVLDGEDIGGLSAHARARKGLVLIPSGRGLMAGLTVTENLRVPKQARKLGPKGPDIDPLDLFPELRKKLHQRAGTMSGGEQQMLALARGLAMKPRYLMIDELSLGLNPVVVNRLLAALKAMREAGVGLLVVEQDVNLALANSDYAIVVNKGVTAFEGPSSEAASRKDLFRPVFIDATES
jgi:branched-chain amino acid transport system ATP-binding protein